MPWLCSPDGHSIVLVFHPNCYSLIFPYAFGLSFVNVPGLSPVLLVEIYLFLESVKWRDGKREDKWTGEMKKVGRVKRISEGLNMSPVRCPVRCPYRHRIKVHKGGCAVAILS